MLLLQKSEYLCYHRKKEIKCSPCGVTKETLLFPLSALPSSSASGDGDPRGVGCPGYFHGNAVWVNEFHCNTPVMADIDLKKTELLQIRASPTYSKSSALSVNSIVFSLFLHPINRKCVFNNKPTVHSYSWFLYYCQWLPCGWGKEDPDAAGRWRLVFIITSRWTKHRMAGWTEHTYRVDHTNINNDTMLNRDTEG